MAVDAQELIGDNCLILHIYLSAGRERKKEVGMIGDWNKGCQNNFQSEKIVFLLNGAVTVIDILRKMFEDNPEKSTIVLKEKCSDCGCDTIIEITPTSSGFGLMGGFLFKSPNDKYTAKCPACYEKHFKVDIAVNGNKAITAIKKAIETNKPYELIFLDIIMPELDGITTLKKIRQLETQHGENAYAKSKIIMTSAIVDKDIILKTARAGCTSYMIKPIDRTRLYDEIRKHGFDVPE